MRETSRSRCPIYRGRRVSPLVLGLICPSVAILVFVAFGLLGRPAAHDPTHASLLQSAYLQSFGSECRIVRAVAAADRAWFGSATLVVVDVGALALVAGTLGRRELARVGLFGLALVALLWWSLEPLDSSLADGHHPNRLAMWVWQAPLQALRGCGCPTVVGVLLTKGATMLTSLALLGSVVAMAANLKPSPKQGPDPICDLCESVRKHRLLLYTAALVLSLATVNLGHWLQWPIEACGTAPTAAGAIDEAAREALDAWNRAIVVDTGMSLTVVLAAAYVPGVVCFRARVRAVYKASAPEGDPSFARWLGDHGLDRSLVDELLPIVAVASPFLGGFAVKTLGFL